MILVIQDTDFETTGVKFVRQVHDFYAICNKTHIASPDKDISVSTWKVYSGRNTEDMLNDCHSLGLIILALIKMMIKTRSRGLRHWPSKVSAKCHVGDAASR